MEEAITVFGIAWRFAVGAATVIALAFIVWNIAAAIEERRIERQRKAQWEARRSVAQQELDAMHRRHSTERQQLRGEIAAWKRSQFRIVVRPARRERVH